MSPIRRLRTHVHGTPGGHTYAVGAAVLVGMSVVLLLVYSQSLQRVSELFSGSQTVKAQFANTQQLKPGDEVRVDGVSQGKVKKIELDQGARSATVTMRLSKDPELHGDATAALRFKLLLGGSLYVDLEPGSGGAGSLGSRTIPLDRTSNQVELDDVATAIKGGARKGLRTFPAQLAETFADRDTLPSALRAASRVAPSVERGVGALRGQPGSRDLRTLVRATADTMRALDTPHKSVKSFVEGGAATMATFAARRDDLAQTFARTPGVAQRADVTLARLDHTLGLADTLLAKLDGPADDVAPTLARLRPAAVETDRLLVRATPLLRSLRPTVSSLARLARDGAPLMRELRPSFERLDGKILPYLAEDDPEQLHSTAEMFGGGVTSLATATITRDANGHLLSFPATGGSSPLMLPCQQYFGNPSAEVLADCTTLKSAFKTFLSYSPTQLKSKAGKR